MPDLECPRYRRLTFDDNELGAIKEACSRLADREHSQLEDDDCLESFVAGARRARSHELAGEIAALFKPGQPVLIEPEDIEPLRECLAACREKGEAAESALRKIEEAIK